MPLRDHQSEPYNIAPFEGIHSGWPMVMLQHVKKKLPPGYSAAPQVSLGTGLEFDLAAYSTDTADDAAAQSWSPDHSGDAVGTATLARPEPNRTVACAIPEPAEYELRIYNKALGRKLVAVVEIVSPSNKDRPESRRTFVAKCASLLQKGVSVAIVDICGTPRFNLYAELLDWVGVDDPKLEADARLYAVACRTRIARKKSRLENWTHVLAYGQPLPTLPIWLSDDLWVPLDLEASYESVCDALDVPPFNTSTS